MTGPAAAQPAPRDHRSRALRVTFLEFEASERASRHIQFSLYEQIEKSGIAPGIVAGNKQRRYRKIRESVSKYRRQGYPGGEDFALNALLPSVVVRLAVRPGGAASIHHHVARLGVLKSETFSLLAAALCDRTFPISCEDEQESEEASPLSRERGTSFAGRSSPDAPAPSTRG